MCRGMTIDKTIEFYNGLECYTPQAKEARDVAISTMHKYQQLEDFAKWVAVEVIDEELWTYNHLAFAEIACRKLVRLGIMQESNGEYTYEVAENGNN